MSNVVITTSLKQFNMKSFKIHWQDFVSSDFVNKVSQTFLTRVILMAVGLVASILVARILGPEGRGLYAVAVAIGAFGIQFGNLGLHSSNTYYVAKNRGLLPSLVGNSLVVSFVFGGLGAIVAYFIFYLWPNLAPIHGFLLFLALAWVPFGLAYLLLQNVFIGIFKISTYNAIELINKILCVLFIIILALLGITNVELVFIAGFLALVVGLFWSILSLKPYLDKFPSPSLDLFKNNFRYGLKAYWAAFFAFLVTRLGLFMIQYMLGAEQTGYYSVAVAMADAVYMFPVVVGTILFPKLSAIEDGGIKRRQMKKAFLYINIVAIPIIIILVLTASPIIKTLFGQIFSPAIPVFIYFAIGTIFICNNTVFMNYFASDGMPLITIYAYAIALICNLFLNLIFIKQYGIEGVAVAFVITQAIVTLISLLYFSKTKAI